MATQRDGVSDDRPASGVSGGASSGVFSAASRRDPPVIDGQAREVGAAARAAGVDPSKPAPDILPAEALAANSPAAATDADADAQAEPAGPTDGAAAAPPRRKRRRGMFRYVLGAGVALGAVGIAWLVTPEDYGPGDLRTQIVASLPEQAQSAIRLAQTSLSPAAGASKPGATASVAPKPVAPKPVSSKPFGALVETSKPSAPEPIAPETPKPVAVESGAPKAAEAAATPTPAPPAATSQIATSPPAAPTAAPSAAPAAPTAEAQPAPAAAPVVAPVAVAAGDATAGRLDALAARIEALQARLDAATAPVADESAARLEALTKRLAALEAKLDQPKSDARAPQPRENAAAPAADPSAARAVVAQALVQALGAGAPLESNIAALRNLGVADDRLADLTPFAAAGAPSLAQLTTQWAGLRTKIVAADAPPVSDDWVEKWMAKAQSMVKVHPMGAQSGASAAAVFSRVDAALKRGDLAEAVSVGDTLPNAAKAAAAAWRSAASARLKADAAARAVLSDSIAALGRTKS